MKYPEAGSASARSAGWAIAAGALLALAACAPPLSPAPQSRPGSETAPSARFVPAPRNQAADAAEPEAASALRPARRADFGGVQPGSAARHVADWVVDSDDHRNAPFLIIDKVAAHAYMFDRRGKLIGHAPVLLGLAKGDDTPAGIGEKPLSAIRPEERITGAGRYVGELGHNLRGDDVLWVDYDEGLSLHRVLTTNRSERRAQRLATPTPLDNRVSYGCINVPVGFFDKVVRQAYRGTKGMVYVLPETRLAQTVFGSYDVDERVRREAARHATAQPR